MRHHLMSLVICTGLLAGEPALPAAIEPPHPAIDREGYLRVAHEAAAHRELHRVSDGYRNVYELGPLLDLEATKREFECMLAPDLRR